MSKRKIAILLQECIERIEAGSTAEQCLAAFPAERAIAATGGARSGP